MAQHVLLADDSNSVHSVVKDVLSQHGIKVVCVENGEEALRSLLEQPPSLVLADLTMPRMGGLELCELMKREPEFQHIPVVFLVSPFDEFNEDAAVRVGGAGQLVKPFDRARLLAVVQGLMPVRESDSELVIEDSSLEGPSGVWDTGTGSDLDAADVPEPMGLSGMGPGDGTDGLMSLELSDLNSIDGDTAELAPEALTIMSEATLEHAIPLGSVHEGVLERLSDLGGPAEIERIAREVIREEVRRILPAVLEQVVRERVASLEAEVEQQLAIAALRQ